MMTRMPAALMTRQEGSDLHLDHPDAPPQPVPTSHPPFLQVLQAAGEPCCSPTSDTGLRAKIGSH